MRAALLDQETLFSELGAPHLLPHPDGKHPRPVHLSRGFFFERYFGFRRVPARRPASFQVESCIVALRTLKRRVHDVREVPVPRQLVRRINRRFDFARARRHPAIARPCLWRWSSATGWRIIKRVMQIAHIAGYQATPRGLRHSFAIASLQAGLPLNLVQRWMGHARISTTAIYAAACGPEELAFAEQVWRNA